MYLLEYKKLTGRKAYVQHPKENLDANNNRMLWIIVLWILYLPYGSFHKSCLPYKEMSLRHPSESTNTLSNVIL